MKILKLYFLIMLVSGCVSATGDKSTLSTQPIVQKSQLAELSSVVMKQDYLVFEAVSFGCTKSSHFKLDYSLISPNQLKVAVVRLKPDYCKKKPELKRFKLRFSGTIDEHSQVIVVNPFKAFGRPSNSQ